MAGNDTHHPHVNPQARAQQPYRVNHQISAALTLSIPPRQRPLLSSGRHQHRQRVRKRAANEEESKQHHPAAKIFIAHRSAQRRKGASTTRRRQTGKGINRNHDGSRFRAANLSAITSSASLAMVLSSMAMTVLNETARTRMDLSVSFLVFKSRINSKNVRCLYAGMPAARTPFLSILLITLQHIIIGW